MTAQKLIVFVKAPRPGTVKTRLAQAIGPQAACDAYRTLVEATLAQLAALADVELRFSPDDAISEIKPWLRESWRARPQGAGDLGARLHAAFTEAFAGGAERVTLIGSDCPKLTTRDIKASWAALSMHDLVLGPAKDGGYWLIALRGPRRALFEGIHWSTDRVLCETLDRAAAAHLRVRLLRELEDVDTEAQWRATSRQRLRSTRVQAATVGDQVARFENRGKTAPSTDVTRLLDAIDQGDPKAAEELLPLVYGELRKLAAHKMAHEAPGQTLQPTALVHEAWLRLVGSPEHPWNSRGHFFAAAAEAMRRILIDKARRKNRFRHGKGLTRADLNEVDLAIDTDNDTLLRVDEALEELAAEDRVKAELVKLRYFAGLSIPEAGRALGVSESTAKRYWVYARAWLYDKLKRSE